MNRHLLGTVCYVILSAIVVTAALAMGWAWVAYAVIVAAAVVGGVLATAFMRARGHAPEHHAPVDRHLHDTER